MKPFTPSATYRVQFHREFRFRDLQPLLPYLAGLGIDTIYASPIFEARPGSTHGYDVTNANRINPEIGTMAEFESLREDCRKYGLHWLQDIVPNHMAFHPENDWLMDVFEKGPASAFYHFFDVNWQYPDPEFAGKLMAPFLGNSLSEALVAEDVKITFNDQGFFVAFYENEFPVSQRSWPEIGKFLLENGTGTAEKTAGIQSLIRKFPALFLENPSPNQTDWEARKREFLHLIIADDQLKNGLQIGIENLQKSPDITRKLLEQQYFRLEFWKETDSRINYRRFFTINELLCLRMELPEVFAAYHKFILEQVAKGNFQGLRIDHVDGLFDPVAYLQELRRAAGENCYLSVEKILELGEELPPGWPVQGTTGYFFLAIVNQLFTNQRAETELSRTYLEMVPDSQNSDYEALVFGKKLFMLQNHMQGELDNLFALLQELNLMPPGPGFTEARLKEALQMLLAAFPVYRIYTNELPVTGQDAHVVEQAFARADKFALHLRTELTYFYQLFQGEKSSLPGTPEARLHFLMRCQQFTGPLAAKGVEDTTFYNYNRLISHNEVGNNPEIFGITTHRFHQEMQDRQSDWPHAQNATSTHDTKRGEDARMRLNVLTELSSEWRELVQQWQEENQQLLKMENGQQHPSANRIYFLYQALLGAFPMNGKLENDFPDRLKEALTKAVREAKVYSNWSEPNEQYEEDLHEFTRQLFTEDSAFLATFRPFVKKLSFYGMLYSLGQTLLKITAPGTPDIYQGCELWDLSMVDPDNRRPVDFALRQKYLREMQRAPQNDRENWLKTLMESWEDGRVKFFTTWQALNFRKQNLQLFTEGEYIPLTFSDPDQPNALAFARKLDDRWCLVIVPLFVTDLVQAERYPLGPEVWPHLHLKLPQEAPAQWTNIFTGETLTGHQNLPVSGLLNQFPIALLTSQTL